LFNKFCIKLTLIQYSLYINKLIQDTFDISNINHLYLPLQTLGPSITNVRNAIDKSLAERDANIDKFCTHLDKDIAELSKEVKEVKQEAQVNNFYILTSPEFMKWTCLSSESGRFHCGFKKIYNIISPEYTEWSYPDLNQEVDLHSTVTEYI
jgi:hypothetical protein